MKTIIWDAYGLENPHSGIARHGSHLLKELNRLGYNPLVLRSEPDFFCDSSSLYKTPSPSTKIMHQRSISSFVDQEITEGRCVFHGLSNFNIPSSNKHDLILTIHDLIPLLAPQYVSKASALQSAYLIPKAIRKAKSVICVSRWTQESCKERFPDFAHKFVYIPNGRSECFSNVSRGTMTKRLIFISRYEPYKGFDLVVNILSQLPEDVCLDLVSNEQGHIWLGENAEPLLSSGRIKLLKNLKDHELQKLTADAAALIHCSQYEGFCLPASEALSLGTPVIYRKGSGIDEVVGTGGIGLGFGALEDEWCSAVLEVLDNPSSWRSKALQANSELLSWTKVAQSTLKVYNS